TPTTLNNHVLDFTVVIKVRMSFFGVFTFNFMPIILFALSARALYFFFCHHYILLFISLMPNALLRGEQCNTEAAANHLNHLNQRIVKMPRVANPS
ncbi:hypothetical protein, partial [Vibrio parahaemolyticus]|uniref:hypothetical protein n=1 Tax=Vibrio parahaemolyticus TaxID=670 RepID=UPI001C60FFDD